MLKSLALVIIDRVSMITGRCELYEDHSHCLSCGSPRADEFYSLYATHWFIMNGLMDSYYWGLCNGLRFISDCYERANA